MLKAGAKAEGSVDQRGQRCGPKKQHLIEPAPTGSPGDSLPQIAISEPQLHALCSLHRMTATISYLTFFFKLTHLKKSLSIRKRYIATTHGKPVSSIIFDQDK